MKKMIFMLFASSVFMSSCATLFTGTKQTIQINSVPSGAKIQVDGIDRGVTPAAVSLKKGFEGQNITLKMEGYATRNFQPETTFNPVAVLNLFGMVGWVIDAATGAIMKYEPKSYEIELEKKK